ncbi:hypothetical protein [Puia dinghuensis]|uniref:Uncharacterized protein n=1 Tax=Puia dinghuensis TaxID=1792502 RepID=A0A8J2XSN6_9BACT|nr:hypothetical protein [Puia dinghuensis]GGA92304.1 hypothetical protein GCM10011511_14620 [Puia dinghuensis]
MSVQSRTTTDTLGISSLSIANYTTKSSAGTVNFTSDSMIVSGLTYTVDTTFMTYFYIAGSLYDSISSPLTATLPPTSASAKYQMINSDSLYFPNGGILSSLAPSSTGQGIRYTLKGDSLTLSAVVAQTTGGTTINANETIYLKRQ